MLHLTAAGRRGCNRRTPMTAVAELGSLIWLMRTLLLIAFVSTLLTGCQSRQGVAVTEIQRYGIYDFTPKRSATCEVHRVAMSPKVVDLEFGMKPVTDTMKARWELFPHADRKSVV